MEEQDKMLILATLESLQINCEFRNEEFEARN
jgi:hypothetical protein